MNKKLLLTDIITTTLGLVLLCVVQLIKSFNPALLTIPTIPISFLIGMVVFGIFIMLFSYKNNTESVTKGNLIIQATLAIFFAACVPIFGLADVFGPDYPIYFSFSGLFASRFMFSRLIYLKEHKTTRTIKLGSDIKVKSFYSSNISDDPSEAMKTIGYMILFLCALFLIILTVNFYYPIIV